MTELPSINEGIFREGIQAVHPKYGERGVSFTLPQHLELGEALGRFKVDYIEFGSPVISTEALRTARALTDLISTSFPNTGILIHSRAKKTDIDAALTINGGGSKIQGIELYMGTSPQNRQGNGNKTIDQIISTAIDAATYIRQQDPSLLIRFGSEDGFRTPLRDLLKVISHIAPYVDRISIPDTTGGADPLQVFYTVLLARLVSGNKEIQFHGHNDAGLVGANYLAALRAGVKVFDTSILGLGERNGIESLYHFVRILYRYYGRDAVREKFDLPQLQIINKLVATYLGIPIPSDQAFAFDDVAGVHLAAQRKNPLSYRIFDASDFGITPRVIIGSAVVGANAVQMRAQQLGFNNMSLENARRAAAEIQDIARLTNSGITPQEADTLLLKYV